MSGPKIVLLVLIVLALLFVGGVALGLRPNSESGGFAWVEGLSGALTPRLEFAELKGPCLDARSTSFVIPTGSFCEISIPSSKGGARKMALRLMGGVPVDGQYRAPPNHEKIDKNDESGQQSVKLEVGKEIAVVILKEGGNLSLLCPKQETPSCQVEVK